jgi:hypothetical protein
VGLKWNFNIANKLGVGFHQYSFRVIPSHSCLRLQEQDARFLYDWADQWVLADAETVKSKRNTCYCFFGKYDFKAPKPWLQLLTDPASLNITDEEMQQIVQPHLNAIMKEQKIKQRIKNNTILSQS